MAGAGGGARGSGWKTRICIVERRRMPTDADECDVLSLKFQKPQATEEFPVRGLAVRAGREALGLDFDVVSFSAVHIRVDTNKEE